MQSSVLCLCLFFVGTHSANILGVFMMPSISHQVVFQPIWRELSLRGHKVTAITPSPLNDPALTNLTEINVDYTYAVFQSAKLQEIMSKELSTSQSTIGLWKQVDASVEAQLADPHTQELITNHSKNFDLIIVEYYQPAMLGFMARFNAPVLEIASLGPVTWVHEEFGNPTHPVLYPDIFETTHLNLSLWEKIQHSFFNRWSMYHLQHSILPKADAMAKKYFGKSIPKVGDLLKNVKMIMHNTNPVLYTPRPYVPAVVGIGQMHLKPNRPLPKDLQNLLDDATEGVVYFSLGSNVKSVHISDDLRRNIVEALAELPYKTLWKWEVDDMPDKPQNVIIRKWFPQQDLLAHKNVKAFISQGGFQSVEEAITRQIPIVGMPFAADQPMNIQGVIAAGIGLGVDPAKMTKEELKTSVLEVVENPQYKKRIKEVCELMYDKPMTGLEQVVWWSEYFIRHKNTDYLKSPAINSSWIEYLLLDVIFTIVLLLVITLWVCCTIKKRLIRRL